MKKLVLSLLLLTAYATTNPKIPQTNANSCESTSFTSGVVLYSPINKTYSSNFLTLNLTAWVGIGINCTITYNIDNKHHGNVPLVAQHPNQLHMQNQVAANLTLPKLTPGTHNLTLQVVCSIHNSHIQISQIPVVPKSTNHTFNTATWTDTIQFTINTSEQQIPEFSSITTVVMVVAVMILAAIIYQKNLKKWVC